MLADTELFTLLNVSSVTSLLDSFTGGVAIFNANLIPESFTGTKCINFYSGLYNARLEYGDYTYTVNCRARQENDSKSIASAVISVLNRVFYNNVFMSVSKLPTIGPADDTDTYNTPIEVTILDKE